MYNIIGYDITSDTTFTNNGLPYVFTGSIQGHCPKIMPGATLTIESGVVVLFGAGYIPNTTYTVCEGLEVHGNIKATGTTFTWFTQGRYWGNIQFYTNSYGSFTDCIIQYGGAGAVTYGVLQTWRYSGDPPADNVKIEIKGGSISNILTKVVWFSSTSSGSIKIDGTHIINVQGVVEQERESIGVETIINNCIIENTSYQAILTAGGNLAVTNSTFRNVPYSAVNTWGLWRHPDNVIVTNNIFDGSGPLRLYMGSNINKDIIESGNTFINVSSGNNFAVMAGYIPANQNVFWGEMGIRYYIAGSPNGTQDFTCSLTIGPGVCISTLENFTFYGNVSALGTPEKPVTFTSENNPKNYLFGKGHLLFEHCIFEKVYYAIQIEDCSSEDISGKVSLTLRNSIFRNNGLRAIWLKVNRNYNMNNVLIDSCSFISNNGFSIYFEGCSSASKASIKIVSSTFLYNYLMPVFLTHDAELTFENCTFSANNIYGGWAIGCSDYNSCKVYLKNCIVWDNILPIAPYPNTFIVNYSCIQISDSDFSRINGSNNINLNPMFEGSSFPIDVYVNSSVNSSGDGSSVSPYKTIKEAVTIYQEGFSHALVTGSPCIGTGENGANIGASDVIAQSQKTTSMTIHIADGDYDNTDLLFYNHISVIGKSRDTTRLKSPVFGLQTGARLEKVKITDNVQFAVLISAYEGPTIEDCTFTNNPPAAAYNGAGIYVYYAGFPYIKNCIISSNHGGSGGIIYAEEKTSPTITDCIINDNGSSYACSIQCYRAACLTIKNCVIAYSSNHGIRIDESAAIIENCTITKCGNYGIYSWNSTAVIHNCIIYDNNTNWSNPAGNIYSSNPALITVSYCDVKGWTGTTGNIDADPLFADAANRDFHLKSEGGRWNPQTSSWVIDPVTSPCIDSGDPTSDYSNEPEPNGTRVNMGVYGNTIYASKSKAAVDLRIDKGGSSSPVYLGNNIVYPITITNFGPSTATGIVMEDVLQNNVIFVSAKAITGNCYLSEGKVICEIDELSSGGLESITITVTPTTEGLFTNIATVSCNEPDTDPSNNSDTVEITVLPATDLSIVKSVSPDQVRANENLNYTITVQNNGPSTATGIKMEDTLPYNVNFVSAQATIGNCYLSEGKVICDIDELSSSELASIKITITPVIDGFFTNIATVLGNEYDNDMSNNTAITETTVLPAADLSIVQIDSPDSVKATENLTYIITVQNNGPSSSTGIIVKDTLPGTVNFLSALPAKGTCSQSEGIVTWELGDLNKSESAVIIIDVIPQTEGTITNKVIISSNEMDPNPDNNSTSEDTTVNPAPTPQELISELTSTVNDLVSVGKLNKGNANSLIAKLSAAMHQINNNNIKAARNQLNAFINQINDFIVTGVLSQQDGQILIDKATKIRNRL